MVAMKSYMYRWLYMCVSNRDVYNWALFIIIRIIDARTGLDEQLACLVRSKPKHLYIFCTFHTRFESLWGCSATVALWCGFAWQVTSDQDIQKCPSSLRMALISCPVESSAFVPCGVLYKSGCILHNTEKSFPCIHGHGFLTNKFARLPSLCSCLERSIRTRNYTHTSIHTSWSTTTTSK